MPGKVLIANRGEIAVRIARTLAEMGLAGAAVYTDADRDSPHVRATDEAVRIGEGRRAYLDGSRLIEAARACGAWGVHPGYGFLSENAEFCEACERAGLVFIGPPARAIREMGDKARARARMLAAGVPIVPGGPAGNLDEARATARRVGYPILVKATAGGGGKGMRRVEHEGELGSALERTASEAQQSFGKADVYIEKAIDFARHVEVQILADQHGNVLHLFERDCSLQRRHQKIVEETPCPVLSEATRQAMGEVAIAGARAIGYYSAGTFEFLFGTDQSFYFLEMNTRLQVEHPITELTTGVDLVREMIRVADGEPLSFATVDRRGAAIEARVYAEDADLGFLPSPGRIEQLQTPAGPFVRDDGGVRAGSEVSAEFDPLLSKLSVWAPTRAEALARLRRALAEYRVLGVTTNLGFLERLIDHSAVRAGHYDTKFVERHAAELGAAARPGAEQEPAFLAALAAYVDASPSAEPRATEPAARPSRWRELVPTHSRFR